jgi:hypothetical protein
MWPVCCADKAAATDNTRTELVRRPYVPCIDHGAMKSGPPGSFGAPLKALREAAGYPQEELATIAACRSRA